MIKIFSSPLQGYTDFRFRNAFRQYFSGVDFFMAPYIRLDSQKEIKAANRRDILPSNNETLDLIPQIITKDAEEFIMVARYVQELGYEHLNWNLGCPYPMVAKRDMGSGLLKSPERIDAILNCLFAESGIRISVKMRLGYESPDEIFQVLPVLDKYPLDHIAIHPRIGKQLYKGEVLSDAFAKCIEQSRHRLVYNGDIHSVQKFREIQDRFPGIDTWMLGRGLIADPFLPAMIKENTLHYPEDRIETFRSFHDTLLSSYSETLSGSKHLLQKMFSFWEYFILSFPGSEKGLKKIKKARSVDQYREIVSEILDGSGKGFKVQDR